MSGLTIDCPIKRFSSSGVVEERQDRIALEYALSIRVDGHAYCRAVLSPAQIKEFTVGLLFSRGLIRGPGDLETIEMDKGLVSVKRFHPAQEALLNAGKKAVHVGEGPFIAAGVILEGIKVLAHMPVFKTSGCTHSAVIFSISGKALCQSEDIARHNSVDKCIGAALLNGIDLYGCWLAVSGRLAEDMVAKAVTAGIPIVASISAATSGGAALGKKSGITTVGFCRDAGFNCYSHPERII